MNIQEAIAVLTPGSRVACRGRNRRRTRPIGILSEAHAMRRYAEESEQRRREAVGDI